MRTQYQDDGLPDPAAHFRSVPGVAPAAPLPAPNGPLKKEGQIRGPEGDGRRIMIVDHGPDLRKRSSGGRI